MSVIKKATIQYVAPYPMPNGISMDMPARIRVRWFDELNRLCSRQLSLIDEKVERVRELLVHFPDIKLRYYPAVPDLNMPAHVRLQGRDEMGRLHHHLLDLADVEVRKISELPDDKEVKW